MGRLFTKQFLLTTVSNDSSEVSDDLGGPSRAHSGASTRGKIEEVSGEYLTQTTYTTYTQVIFLNNHNNNNDNNI